MPIDAARLKAIQDRFRAGEVSTGQSMLLELQHEQEAAELETQIAAGNPPAPATPQETLLLLLEGVVQHLGSPAVLVKHLVALKEGAQTLPSNESAKEEPAANIDTEHPDEAHAS